MCYPVSSLSLHQHPPEASWAGVEAGCTMSFFSNLAECPQGSTVRWRHSHIPYLNQRYQFELLDFLCLFLTMLNSSPRHGTYSLTPHALTEFAEACSYPETTVQCLYDSKYILGAILFFCPLSYTSLVFWSVSGTEHRCSS